MKIDLELLNEVSEFAEVDKKEILQRFDEVSKEYPNSKFLKWIKISEKEWKRKKINQKDELEISNFYQQTSNYIFELVEYHSSNFKKRLIQRSIDMMKQNNCHTIVDYGCGIGQDSIMQNIAGLQATAADLPGKTFDFAKFRFKERGLNIKTIDIIPGEMPLKEKYDAITCFEVLQHLINPERTIEHFHEHLNDSGLLLVTYRFKGNYSLALKANEEYEENFAEVIIDKGFKLKNIEEIFRPADNRVKKLEVYKK